MVNRRAALAHSSGLRTVFHFGAPFQGRAGFDGVALPQCISDPRTTVRYVDAVYALAAAAPDIDDLLVYTYDQDAWLCSEFDGCDLCSGIPLHLRVPKFINSLATAWQTCRPGSRLWWEPWELSAGQCLASIPLLEPTSVGLMLHSNIGEVVSTMPADAFFRNAAATARRHDIPVIGELFLSSSNEEVEPWRHLPVPLVTLDQLRAVERVNGVSGIKEYFGIRSPDLDVNMMAASLYFMDPSTTDDYALTSIADRFDRAWLSDFWRECSRAYSLYPWDSSWFARQLGNSEPLHELSAATVRGTQAAATEWDTPAWRSSRSATFMRITSAETHSWLLEDVELRFAAAASAMEDAVSLFTASFTPSGDALSAALIDQLDEVVGFIVRCNAYRFHLRATNIADALRRGSTNAAALIEELKSVLRADLENQRRELARKPHEAQPTPLQLSERWMVADRNDLRPIEMAITALDGDLNHFLTTYFTTVPDAATAGQFSLTSR